MPCASSAYQYHGSLDTSQTHPQSSSLLLLRLDDRVAYVLWIHDGEAVIEQIKSVLLYIGRAL